MSSAVKKLKQSKWEQQKEAIRRAKETICKREYDAPLPPPLSLFASVERRSQVQMKQKDARRPAPRISSSRRRGKGAREKLNEDVSGVGVAYLCDPVYFFVSAYHRLQLSLRCFFCQVLAVLRYIKVLRQLLRCAWGVWHRRVLVRQG